MFSKRHYEAFAERIQLLSDPQHRLIAIKICLDVFCNHGNHFNASRFSHACQPGSKVKSRTEYLKADIENYRNTGN
jgi:hypothetical protein